MKIPRSTLEQWQVLQAIVECGGYAQAAEALHRSQSSVSYMVAKLQEQLGIELLEIDGRRARLTQNGATLLRKARELLDDAFQLEELAASLNEGWESELRFAVDSLFPSELLIQILQEFEPLARHTRVNLEETILSASDDVLREKRADVVIANYVPSGFLGDALLDIEFLAVAHPSHPLHGLDRDLNEDDLERHLHIVVRDGGVSAAREGARDGAREGTREGARDFGWLNTAQRWTVTSPATRTEMVCAGLGFAWMATHKIQNQLASGLLKPLRLRVGQKRKLSLSLIIANAERPGPAACQLVSIIRAVIARHCKYKAGGCPAI